METIITKVPAIANYLGNRLLDSPVEVLATELSKGAFKWIKSLFFDKKNNPKDIVVDLRNDPNDEDNREAVRIQLTKALKKDPAAEQWVQEIYSLLQKKAEAGDVDAINTLNSDNSRIETTIIADGDVEIRDNRDARNVLVSNISTHGDVEIGDIITNKFIYSYPYKELESKLEKLKHDFEVHKQLIYTYPDDEHFKTKLQEIDAEREGVKEQIDDFKKEVLALAEIFRKIPISTTRMKIAREYFEKGDYEASRTILNSVEIGRELEQLLQKKEQLHGHKENVDALLRDKSDEYLILARLTELDFSDPSRFEQTKYYYEQSIRAYANPRNFFAFARFLSKQGEDIDAEKIYNQVLEFIHEFDKEHSHEYEPEHARTLNNLAILHSDQKKYEEAEKEYKECLAISRKLGLVNPHYYERDIARVLYNLAILHSDQKKYEEAEKKYEEFLAISRRLSIKNLDDYERDKAVILNKLALGHHNQHKYAKAEREYNESLKIFRALSLSDPNVYERHIANILNNLAILHSDQEKYEEAEKEYKECLGIYKKLSLINPQVYEPELAHTLNNLAVFYRAQKKYEEAEKEYKEVLEIRKKLAETNPLVHEPELARTLNTLANFHRDQEKFEEADEEYTQASVIHLKTAMKGNGTIEMGYIEIQGYKSIKSAKISLSPINILIGSNGAGKSNFLSFFELLESLYQNRLKEYTATHGGMEIIPHKGVKKTNELSFTVGSERNNWYKAALITGQEGFLFQSEEFNIGNHRFALSNRFTTESMLSKVNSRGRTFLETTFKNFRKFHFQDTGEQTPFKQFSHIENDIYYLYKDGRNIAAFLYNMKEHNYEYYSFIVKTIQSIAPFFSDFFLQPNEGNYVRLQWRDKYSDTVYGVNDLSDGTIRFIALATLFLQPSLPDTIIIDEPELGLHPFALAKLAGMVHSVANKGTQVIMATHSTDLLNHFNPEDIITVDQRDGETTFKRLNEKDLAVWLEDYSVGDLWEQGIISNGQPF